MGLEIDRDRFESIDFERFDARLRDSLRVLEALLKRKGFGLGPTSIGAELEVSLIGDDARPLPLNVEILRETLDPRMTVELDRFNLECNLRYGPLAGAPFAALRRELEEARCEIERAAALHSGRVVMVGILPTVRVEDLDTDAMTDTARYRALAHALREARQAPFHLHIDGDDPLVMDHDNVTFEGAATSLQIHLRATPDAFGPLFNAIQLATAPSLAVAGNSPLFIGHRLWHETRVALFKQAVDERRDRPKGSHRLPRVGFGRAWVRGGAYELFREAVETFPSLLPVLSGEDPRVCLEAGGIPKLQEIRLHQGTVWSWNRPVYDPAGGGHLRIELRALPSGPTHTDMLANAALLVGLAYGLAPEIEELMDRIAFEDAHDNFYRAAQRGLDSELKWPDGAAGVSTAGGRIRAGDLAAQLVEVARSGLRSESVDAADFEPLLDVISARIESGQTGAVWQRKKLARLEEDLDRRSALAELVETYVRHSNEDVPVHRWPL
jgi:hypothetical protein